MPQWIHADFLKDARAYSAAQQYWEAAWAQVLSQTGSETGWETYWMKNPLANGNPIFTARSPTLRRGVRIIQEEPGEHDNQNYRALNQQPVIVDGLALVERHDVGDPLVIDGESAGEQDGQ